MTALPSVSNSITVRLTLPARATAVSELTGVIEKSGGLVTGLDVTASGADRIRVDVTAAARDTTHADEIVEQMRGVHGGTLTQPQLEQLVDTLCALPLAARRTLPGLQPKRADVIPAGSLVLLEALRALRLGQCRVSDRGLRWGLMAHRFGAPLT